jgi:ribonuclease P protein component
MDEARSAAPERRAQSGNLADISMAKGLARLRTRAEFLRVAAARRRAARPGLVLQAAVRSPDSDDDIVRVGFTASRKVGNAVVRNRAKRRLRAAAAEVLARAGRPGTDYVLIARDATSARAYADLVGDLAAALRQIEQPRRGGARQER